MFFLFSVCEVCTCEFNTTQTQFNPFWFSILLDLSLLELLFQGIFSWNFDVYSISVIPRRLVLNVICTEESNFEHKTHTIYIYVYVMQLELRYRFFSAVY